jgi:subtilisin family serine protease
MLNHGRLLHKSKLLAFLLCLNLVCTLALAEGDIPAVPGEFLVKLKTGNSRKLAPSALSQKLGGPVRYLSPQSGSVLVRRPAIEIASSALQKLSESPFVEYAEPNYIYKINRLPNDPELSKLWGLINVGQPDSAGSEGIFGVDIGVESAWNLSVGSSAVVVAVIDTGVDETLPDLSPNMWVNAQEQNGVTGVDDDNNGFVDDVYGYDFANKDGRPRDDHGHGSHCSGTIGAKGNDNLGIVGVAWNVKIMAVKFLGADGSGNLADAVEAIDYATTMGANIMNNSWGGGGYSKALEEAIQRSEKAGVLFVAAAGNSSLNSDVKPSYPASYGVGNIISVAAVDNKGELAEFSNWGKASVHVAAPGVNIFSTTPSGYESWSGTSMAAPHVSGVAALLLASDMGLNSMELKRRLISFAKPSRQLRNKVMSGMVNAYHAITQTPHQPDAEDPFNWIQESYSLSSPHPYTDNYTETWQISHPGATKIAVLFSKFETELNYDVVTFSDLNGTIVGSWSGDNEDSFSPVINGDTMVISIKSDNSVGKYGFDIKAIAFK